MKKVGIITFYKSDNVGAVLQAYALQKCLFNNGYSAEIIQYIDAKKKGRKMNIIKRLIHNIWYHKIKRDILKDKKWARVISFIDKNDSVSKNVFTSSAMINNDPPIYDVYITGSDQVWNDSITGADDSYYLSFAPESAVKLAYGASCGSVSALMKEKEKKEMLLSKLDLIGVRETNMAVVLKEEFGLNSELVLDPTLLLTKNEWENVASKSEIIRNDNYILCYIMPGDKIVEKGIEEIAKELARQTGYNIVRVGLKDIDRLRFRKNDIFDVGPAEFVKLISDAKYVVTNSFHGSVFSINLGVSVFGVINGELDGVATRASRLISIYNLLGMENRLIKYSTNDDNWRLSISAYSFDYSEAHIKLENERRKSLSFLIKGIELKKVKNG